VVVTEDDGAASSSEARSVAIAQRDVGTGLLAEPPAPLPLGPDASFLGDLVMRSYMPTSHACALLCCAICQYTSRSALRCRLSSCARSVALAIGTVRLAASRLCLPVLMNPIDMR